MVKMVVFDLDGTLMNSLTDLAISVNYGLKLNGLEEKPVENYKTYVGNAHKSYSPSATPERLRFSRTAILFEQEKGLN